MVIQKFIGKVVKDDYNNLAAIAIDTDSNIVRIKHFPRAAEIDTIFMVLILLEENSDGDVYTSQSWRELDYENDSWKFDQKIKSIKLEGY